MGWKNTDRWQSSLTVGRSIKTRRWDKTRTNARRFIRELQRIHHSTGIDTHVTVINASWGKVWRVRKAWRAPDARKTFSAAWLPSRNPLRFLGIVIVHQRDSGLRISLYRERNDAAYGAQLFGARPKFSDMIAQTGRLLSRQSYRPCRFPHQSFSKLRTSSRNINFSFTSFSNIITNLSASRVLLSRNSSLICCMFLRLSVCRCHLTFLSAPHSCACKNLIFAFIKKFF